MGCCLLVGGGFTNVGQVICGQSVISVLITGGASMPYLRNVLRPVSWGVLIYVGGGRRDVNFPLLFVGLGV